MNQHPVYFWGYSGHQLADLQALQAQTKALIIDARHQPYSRFRPEWNQRRLAEVFGDNYRHLPALGNVHYKDGPEAIQIVDLDAGIAAIDAVQRPVIVICTCKAPEGCHITVIRDDMARRGYHVLDVRHNAAQSTLFHG